jgi:hypothetical protein
MPLSDAEISVRHMLRVVDELATFVAGKTFDETRRFEDIIGGNQRSIQIDLFPKR